MSAKAPRAGKVDKPGIGDEIRIEFWDHSQGGSNAMHFKTYGEVLEITNEAYKIGHWLYVSDVDRARDTNPDNEDWHWIVKSTITKLEVLV
jgi:hypothetical protein